MPPNRSPMLAMSATGESSRGAQLGRQRHRPELLARVVGGVDHAVAQVVVVGHDRAHPVAERHHLGAGEGGDVDEDVGLLLARGDQAVGEHEAALGVGVEHLDGAPAVDR